MKKEEEKIKMNSQRRRGRAGGAKEKCQREEQQEPSWQHNAHAGREPLTPTKAPRAEGRWIRAPISRPCSRRRGFSLEHTARPPRRVPRAGWRAASSEEQRRRKILTVFCLAWSRFRQPPVALSAAWRRRAKDKLCV